MKFDIPNRFSGNVQFTADIAANENTLLSIKKRLAVEWAVKNEANLNGANLNEANLYRANLNGANLNEANLNGANLNGANLNEANLNGANLYRANLNGANLNEANLNGANLYRANLYGANLNGANLYRANLNEANLDGANLDGANLNEANLYRANLNEASGINYYVKCIQIDQYPIAYTDTILQIGCQIHKITEWSDFDNKRIAEMDGKCALKFWAKYKDWIFQTIELCPAKPTGYVEASE